jgi:hypothetical protein
VNQSAKGQMLEATLSARRRRFQRESMNFRSDVAAKRAVHEAVLRDPRLPHERLCGDAHAVVILPTREVFNLDLSIGKGREQEGADRWGGESHRPRILRSCARREQWPIPNLRPAATAG